MKRILPTGARRALLLWAALSAGAHFLLGEPMAIPYAEADEKREMGSPTSSINYLPDCGSEDVRLQMEEKLNAISTHTLKVETTAAQKFPAEATSRICVAAVTGPLAKAELLFLIQWDKANAGHWAAEFIRQ